MESSLRNTLRLAITAIRRNLEEDYRLQMEGRYDIKQPQDLVGEKILTYLDFSAQMDRQVVAAAVRHEIVQGSTYAAAVERFVRESAFTTLNRLAALKLLEHPSRGVIRESIGAKEMSKGYIQFAKISPAAMRSAARERPDGGYCLYLKMIFDDLSQAIGALFEGSLPQAILFPSTVCLSAVLDQLNQPSLEAVWPDDETIGWIYQYFTPPELRDQARKESAAPRDSNELAFRNQFYTPDYVVEFLTDNTLGRTWYEMTQGKTALIESCRYLVRHKHTIFLARREEPPLPFDPRRIPWGDPDLAGNMWVRPNPEMEDAGAIIQYASTAGGYQYSQEHFGIHCGDLANQKLEQYQQSGQWEGSFEELRCCLFFEWRRQHHFGTEPDRKAAKTILDLYKAICERWNKEVEIASYRERKDPREIRVLDPACGSGHFLLYAFELLQTIYIEDYDSHAATSKLSQDFRDRADFIRQVPRLILENNLHGIDIDLRATQIAGLALWLRAQRSYSEMRLPVRSRPHIRRSNIVWAEPMPGEYDLLGEFLRDLKPSVLGHLVTKVWDQMKVAGEAGSLLQIEQVLKTEIHQAHEMLSKAPPPVQLTLFGPGQAPVQQILRFDEVSDETFWEQAEQRVLDELKRYAEQVSGTASITRRLFAHDAVQGFAFINLLLQPFDVVLMNPPFGSPSLGSRDYILASYPRTKNDLYAAFVERGLELLRPGGMLGAITSRTGFFLKSFQQWREEILLKESSLVAMADLGYGVLDTAMVETAAYVIRKH